jgi:hypothetical protein
MIRWEMGAAAVCPPCTDASGGVAQDARIAVEIAARMAAVSCLLEGMSGSLAVLRPSAETTISRIASIP